MRLGNRQPQIGIFLRGHVGFKCRTIGQHHNGDIMIGRHCQEIMNPVNRIITNIDNAKAIKNQRVEMRDYICQPVCHTLGTRYGGGHDRTQRFVNGQGCIERQIVRCRQFKRRK